MLLRMLHKACFQLCVDASQVTALLLKEYKARFQGAPLTSTYRFLEQVRSICS